MHDTFQVLVERDLVLWTHCFLNHGVGLAVLIHSVTTNHIMKERRNVSFGMFRSEYSFQSNSVKQGKRTWEWHCVSAGFYRDPAGFQMNS